MDKKFYNIWARTSLISEDELLTKIERMEGELVPI
jgi:hypothetical protein